MPYLTQADLETYLQRALTTEEAAHFDATVADAVTAAIDRYTGRTWDGSTVTAELQTVLGREVYLDRKPVTAVSLVRTRPRAIGADWTTLTAGETYELIDAAAGLLLVSGRYDVITPSYGAYGHDLEVTYTVGGDLPPAPVTLAAEMLAASMLASGSAAGTTGASGSIKRFSVDGESVEFDTSTSTSSTSTSASGGMTADVMALLDLYKRPVMFA